jgi:hypothetical protein
MRTTIIKNLMVVLLFMVSHHSLYGQMKDSSLVIESKAEVPALSEFHNVIYPLWHTAWPEKNIKMLVELLPDIEKLSSDVVNAKLPGILREKQSMWDNGMKDLRSVVQEYKTATTPVDTQRLLRAAEQIHSQYEKLVRIVRPPLKELDAFHAVLYKVYHYYLPEWDFAKIQSTTIELREKMDLLNSAQLSKQRESKKEAFTAARTKLDAAVKELEAAVAGGEKKAITDKINEMHTQYVAVEEVFN